jgi:hypothetical protein
MSQQTMSGAQDRLREFVAWAYRADAREIDTATTR